MSRDELFIFRSDDAEVLATLDKMQRTEKAFWRKVERTRKAMCADIGDGNTKRTAVCFRVFGGGQHMVGLAAWPLPNPMPEAWRRDKDALIPRKAHPHGKELNAVLAKVKLDDTRKLMPGMPASIFSGLAHHRPGFEIIDGVMWCTYSTDPGDKVDRDIWAPVKRSAYYAIIESVQAVS